MTTPTCDICTEKFNRTTRVKISCPYCEFDACRDCCQRYILQENVPKCMNNACDKDWTRQFLRSSFTQVFMMRDYKKHREEVLFNNERALLPATQPLVENDIKKENISEQINAKREQIRIYANQINELQHDYNRCVTNRENVERANFIRACPVDDCRGFLSTQWKCGICANWTCPTCHEIKGQDRDAEHTCNPDNIATARLLATDTKPCPKCATGIFKIDGCFAKNTPVMLWDGMPILSQYISVGDILVGDDGRPRTVQEVYSGEDQLYEIQQQIGIDYTVNSKHTLVFAIDNLYEIVEVKIEDFIQWDDDVKSLCYGIRKNESFYHYTMRSLGLPNALQTRHESTVHLSMDTFRIVPKSRGRYYGWRVDGNNRFLLGDGTVVRNCDQMWCTQCHTAFSWRTGRIENVIHNPHYYEWMRRTNNGAVPRTRGDNPCAVQEINHYLVTQMRNVLLIKKPRDAPLLASFNEHGIKLSEISRAVIHMRYVEIPRFAYDHLLNNQVLRVRYMRNQITEEKFKTIVQQMDKKHQKNREIHQILQMVHDATTDIILRFHQEILKSDWNYSFDTINEVDRILEYANECFREISATYNSRCMQLSPLLNLHTI